MQHEPDLFDSWDEDFFPVEDPIRPLKPSRRLHSIDFAGMALVLVILIVGIIYHG